MKVSVVVPVYNEASTIGSVLGELAALELDGEIIVVDDGSDDETPAIISEQDLPLVVERLEPNQGKGVAVRRGIARAQGQILVLQDADLELSPEVIHDLLAPIASGSADAVYGSRFLKSVESVPLARRQANRFLTWLTNRVYGTALTDVETAHKAFRTHLVRQLDLRASRFEIEIEITAKLARSGARFQEIPSPYRPRSRREGRKIRWWDGLLAIATILRYRRWQPGGDR